MKKNQKNKKINPKKRTRVKSYPAHFLAIAIAVLVTVESLVAFGTTRNDWKQGFAILDVSEGIHQMASTVDYISQPAMVAVSAVNEFYSQAAVAATELLVPSSDEVNPMTFVYGVNSFYQQAATQLASVLDISNYGSWRVPDVPKVAGASISEFTK